MPDDVSVNKEVATLHKLAERTARAMARSGDFLALIIWGQRRIDSAELDQWVNTMQCVSGVRRDGE